MNRKVVSWALRLAITVGLFVFLFTRIVDPQEVLGQLAGLSVAWLLAALAVKAGAILASSLRWNLLLRGQGLRFSHPHLLGVFLIGRFFGTFLPSTIGLDAYRAYDIARRADATTQSVAVIIVEKIIGFFALSTLVLITLPAGLRFLPPELLGFAFLVFCVPVSLSFLLLMRPALVMRLIDLPFPFKSRVEGGLRKAAQAVTIYRDQKQLLFAATLFGLLVHTGTMLMYYCTAQAIGAPVTLSDILFVGPLMIVATVGLPSIGGEGVREFTLIGLLARVGVAESSAFTLGHLGFLVGLSLSLIGGAIYLFSSAARPPSKSELEKAMVRPGGEVRRATPMSLAERAD